VRYTFVCDPDHCDTLIEVLPVEGRSLFGDEVKMICPCGRSMNWITDPEWKPKEGGN
jgi:hypothetical protein